MYILYYYTELANYTLYLKRFKIFTYCNLRQKSLLHLIYDIIAVDLLETEITCSRNGQRMNK